MKRSMHFIGSSRPFSTVNPKVQLSVATETIGVQNFALYGQLLDACPEIRTLRRVHCRITLDPVLRSSISLIIKLMRGYAACRQPEVARQLFDGMPYKSVVVFNVMIRSYVSNQSYLDALILFRSLKRSGYVPDMYTIPVALKACSASADLSLGSQVHASVVKSGLDFNIYTGNGLIYMYGKCRCLVEARQVLDELPCKDVVSWNSMVAGYAQNHRFDDALRVCKEMESFRVKHDAGTMASLLPAVTNTSGENILFMEDMFKYMKKEDKISWNVMIAVYVNNSMPNKAVQVYCDMEAHGTERDPITISTVLPACGDLSAVNLGKRIHEYVEQKGLRPNVAVENALVDMYANCGCLQEAREVFDDIKFKDVISWTSMISAYGKSGQGSNAVALFSEMLGVIKPDYIAFVSIISACSHAGLLEEGRHFYKLMTEKYNIDPGLEHLACMVDLLGRAGRVSEAYEFVKQSPLDPNQRIWGALLGACRVHNNIDVGLAAADHLLQLAPNESSFYVLMSNIYAKAGRWKEVTSIRSIMKDKGIKKLPGISNVELKNQVHTFLAGDSYHPQSKEIYQHLEMLIGKAKQIGYVPETDTALHDLEDEDKENHLIVHSEKLAVVFAIINTEAGTPIRITKNLRVCEDCHIAIKLISKITERLVIVRDTNRFHHFENGVCSCGDYW